MTSSSLIPGRDMATALIVIVALLLLFGLAVT
jgi:hypothetical protein